MRMDIAKDGEKTQYQKKNQVASKYKTEYGQMMLDFFIGDESPFPTFERFAVSIGVIAETLANWADKDNGFRDFYAKCKEIQKAKLVEGSMIDKYNAQFAKFFAINNCNMRESSSINVGGATDGQTPFAVSISIIDKTNSDGK